MKETLAQRRDRTYVGTRELAAEAAGLVQAFAPRQERGVVGEVPDERMVRYYLSEGLLSPSDERQGTATVYGYLHLLQLLAIKRLQAAGITNKQIRQVVQGKQVRDLERLLGVREAKAAPAADPKSAALGFLESLLPRGSESAPRLAPSPPEPVRSVPERGATSGRAPSWTRVEIEPGVEVHVRSDHPLWRAPREARRIGRAVAKTLEKASSLLEKASKR
jgi:DNA-binding transcriptional MerR regulator